MTNEHRYILEMGSKKHYCPNCGKKAFVRYIDINTGNYLPELYGRCDREINCSCHFNPYTDGYAKMIRDQERGKYSGNWKPQRPAPMPKPAAKSETVFIPKDVFKQTLICEGYEQNIFIQNLLNNVAFPFETKDVDRIISQYCLGTVCDGYRAGSITFPFIDKIDNVRTIQVKQFDQENRTIGTDFLHSIIEKQHQNKNEELPGWLKEYNTNDSKVSCLFGEHLLNKYLFNPVALVEAPKTAIYGTLYLGFPDNTENLLWLAVYNLSSLNFEKCKVLKGRDVYLFPDLSRNGNAFELWSKKAKEFSDRMPGTWFEISDLLEKLAPNKLKEQGNDIADILIKMDWRKFRTQSVEQIHEKIIVEQILLQPKPEPITVPKSEIGEKSEAIKTNFINDDFDVKKVIENNLWNISQLEDFFNTTALPTHPIKLGACTTITDVNFFVSSHLATVKANNGNRTFLPYFNRLKEIKTKLESNGQIST